MQVCSSSDKPAVPIISLKNRCERDEARQCNIVNANYEKVMSKLERMLRDDQLNDACHCAKCVSDMAALALNRLPPHYYVDAGRGGEIGSPLVMVESAVHEAIETVRNNPIHHR